MLLPIIQRRFIDLGAAMQRVTVIGACSAPFLRRNEELAASPFLAATACGSGRFAYRDDAFTGARSEDQDHREVDGALDASDQRYSSHAEAILFIELRIGQAPQGNFEHARFAVGRRE